MAWQGGEAKQNSWQSSGVEMLNITEVVLEDSQVVLAMRQEGRGVEDAAAWSRRKRRGAMVELAVLVIWRLYRGSVHYTGLLH